MFDFLVVSEVVGSAVAAAASSASAAAALPSAAAAPWQIFLGRGRAPARLGHFELAILLGAETNPYPSCETEGTRWNKLKTRKQVRCGGVLWGQEGKLLGWTNGSGHFKPPNRCSVMSTVAERSGLPLERFADLEHLTNSAKPRSYAGRPQVVSATRRCPSLWRPARHTNRAGWRHVQTVHQPTRRVWHQAMSIWMLSHEKAARTKQHQVRMRELASRPLPA